MKIQTYAAVLCATWLCNAAAIGQTCPDPADVRVVPPFDAPAVRGFRYFWNAWLAQDTPYHMGHDLVVPEHTPTQLTGKFDYGAVFHKDLEYERVTAWLYGPTLGDWQYLGRYTTNGDGKIFVDVPALDAGLYVVKMVVEGDGTQADAYVTVVAPGTEAVVFDIDETLTVDDLEVILDYTGIEWAEPRDGAYELVTAYLDRGYLPVFLTARVYWYARGTRQWLDTYMDLPPLVLRTARSNAEGFQHAADYKTGVLQELTAAGVTLVRAYGNADTDIEAYARAGIPKAETYIIGALAGAQDTQPIETEDYLAHLTQVVAPTPVAAHCR